MSKLQNNFTTPEQSKRLLELGVPAWTADCFHPTDLQRNPIENATPTIITYQLDTHEIAWDEACGFPCWSVGRLIEIIKICSKPKEQATMSEELLYCRDLVGMLVFILEGNRSVMDFSKLEE